MMDVVWDRYVPNFWGPVIAHRLSRRPALLLLFIWSGLALDAVALLGRGARNALRGLSSPTEEDLALG